MDRDELDKKLKVLKKHLEEGKIKLVKDLQVIQSLEKVRYSSDGKVDPSTVDSSVRSLANAVGWIDYQQQLKTIPLRRVQEEYFGLLETFFANPYAQMIKYNLTPHQIASSMSTRSSIVKAFAQDADGFEEGITEFWKNLGPIVDAHLLDLQGLKTVYGGDIFPSYKKNILSTSSLYVDTTILPDPMLRVASFIKFMEPAQGLYYLTKHALSALSLKDIVLADVKPPIAIIAPDPFITEETTQDFIKRIGERDMIVHLEKLFGTTFDDERKLEVFIKPIKDLKTLKRKIIDPERLLFDTDWKGLSLEEQWKKYQKTTGKIGNVSKLSVGEQVKLTAIGRMMQVNELLYKSNNVHGVPLIDAPTSWQYLLWKYEYDAEAARDLNPQIKDTVLVNALQNDRLTWLGNVPIEALIKLRKEGALNELRAILSKGISNIEKADERTYNQTVDGIIGGINEAFYKHLEDLKKYSTNKKFFGFDVASFLVEGGVVIASTSTGNIPLSVISGVLSLAGIPNAKDIWKKGNELLKEGEKIHRSPVGILFDAREEEINLLRS